MRYPNKLLSAVPTAWKRECLATPSKNRLLEETQAKELVVCWAQDCPCCPALWYRVPHSVTCWKILLIEFINISCGMSLSSLQLPSPILLIPLDITQPSGDGAMTLSTQTLAQIWKKRPFCLTFFSVPCSFNTDRGTMGKRLCYQAQLISSKSYRSCFESPWYFSYFV